MPTVEEIILDIRAKDNATRNLKKAEKGVQSLGQRIKILGTRMERFGRNFRMEYLSVLFFGMAMQRIFSGILKSGSSTFQKLMESSNMFGTAISRLSLHFEYLKFVLGSAINTALEPLMPSIINIINLLSDWIQRNPKLTSGILGIGVAIGTLLMAIGTVVLGINGLLALFGTSLVKIGGVVGVFNLLKTAIMGVFREIGFFISGLRGVLQTVGRFTLLGTLGTWIRTAWFAVSGALQSVWQWLVGVWGVVAAIAAPVAVLVGILVALFIIIKRMIEVGFVQFWKDVWEGIKNVYIMFDDLQSFFNTQIIQMITNGKSFLDVIIDLLSYVNQLVNALTGLKLPTKKSIAGSVVGSKQFGGEITKGGLYRLHAGETVVPRGGSTPNITINVNGAGGNAESIARMVEAKLLQSLRRNMVM